MRCAATLRVRDEGERVSDEGGKVSDMDGEMREQC